MGHPDRPPRFDAPKHARYAFFVMGKYLLGAVSFLLFTSTAEALGPSGSDWVDSTGDLKAVCVGCPGSYVLNAVHGKSRPDSNNASASPLWAVGNAGLILKFDGTNWKTQPSPTAKNLYDVYINPDGTGWACGEGGTIIYLNGAGNWSCSNCPNGNCVTITGGGALRTCSDLYEIFPAEPYGSCTTLFIVGGSECDGPEPVYGILPTTLYWNGTQWKKLTYDPGACAPNKYVSYPGGACEPYGVDQSSLYNCGFAEIYSGAMGLINGSYRGMIFGYSLKPGFQRYEPFWFQPSSAFWVHHGSGFADGCASPKPGELTSAVIGNYIVGGGDADDCKSWRTIPKVYNLFYASSNWQDYEPLDTGLTDGDPLIGSVRRIDFLPLWGFGIGVGSGPGLYSAARPDAYFVHFRNPDPTSLPNAGANRVSYWQKPAAKTWKRLNGVFIDNYNDAWSVGDTTILHWTGPALNPAVLATSFTSTVTGMYVSLILSVTNTGEAAIKDLDPRGLAMSMLPAGLTGAVLVSAPSKLPGLPPGGSAFFTWTYSFTGYGNDYVRFTGTAAGWDVLYSGISGTLSSGASFNQNLALSSAMSVVASRKCSGLYTLGITMTVTNTGSRTASSITIDDPTISDPTAVKTGGPSPAPPAGLVTGASTSVTWTYTVSTLSLTVTGVLSDAIVGAPDEHVSSRARYLYPTLMAPALSSTISVATYQSGFGSYYKIVTMDVFNHSVNNMGGMAATTTQTSPAGASLLTGPTPAPANIAAGTDAIYTWTYSSPGPVASSFTGQADGTDSITTYPTCTTAAASPSVLQASPLSSTLSITTAQFGPTQYYFLAVLDVFNNSPVNTINNLILTLTQSGGPWAGLTNPTALPVTSPSINPLTTQSFTWEFSATGFLPANFTGEALGTDNSTWPPYAIPAYTSATAMVSAATSSNLSSVMTVSAIQLATNKYFFTVTMSVKNNGGVNIDLATPSSTQFGSPWASMMTAPLPGVVTIAPLATSVYTWTYTATGALPATFTGVASGVNSFTGLPEYTSATGTANSASTSLTTTVATQTITLGPNQYCLIVRMTVTNTGVDTLTDLTATPNLSFTGLVSTSRRSGPILYGSSPSATGYFFPKTLATGQGCTFEWTYSFTGNPVTVISGSVNGSILATSAQTSKDFSSSISAPQTPISTTMSTITHKLGKNQYHVRVEVVAKNNTEYAITAMTGSPTLTFDKVTYSKMTGPTAFTCTRVESSCAGGSYCGVVTQNDCAIFVWTYTVSGSLPSAIAGSVSGSVTAWGLTATETSTGWTSEPETSCLASSLSITPTEEKTTLASRWKLQVIMTITNTGRCAGSYMDMTPYQQIDVTPAGQAWYMSGPLPTIETAIAQGNAGHFTWTFSATGSSTFTLASSAMAWVNMPNLSNSNGPEDFPDYTEATATITTVDTGSPGVIKLNRNLFPSANTKLEIWYNLKEDDTTVTLTVYNSLSQRIRTLHTGLIPRRVDIQQYWDGKNDNGDRVSSGVYYIRLETRRYVSTKKVIVIK